MRKADVVTHPPAHTLVVGTEAWTHHVHTPLQGVVVIHVDARVGEERRARVRHGPRRQLVPQDEREDGDGRQHPRGPLQVPVVQGQNGLDLVGAGENGGGIGACGAGPRGLAHATTEWAKFGLCALRLA